ncbi:abcB1 [Acrasis kona]|uniref:AbcB1 n=1 Tax=Acrasis kona TaxID=1008807 RepID=A0AAW2YVA1_9EUKA
MEKVTRRKNKVKNDKGGGVEPVEKSQGSGLNKQGIIESGQIKWLIKHIKKESFNLSMAAIGIVIASGMNVCVPFFVGRLVDSITQIVSDRSSLLSLVFLLLFLVIGMSIFNGMRHYFIITSAERIASNMRYEVFQKIMEQDVEFFDHHSSGELVGRLSTDTNALQACVSFSSEMMARSILDFMGCVCILFNLSYKLLFIILLIVPIIGIGSVVFQRFLGNLGRDAGDYQAQAATLAQESISSIRSVKSMAQEHRQMQIYNNLLTKSSNSSRRGILGAATYTGGMVFASGICTLMVLWYGGTLVLDKELTTGQLASFLAYTAMATTSLMTISNVYLDIKKALSVSERVYEIITRAPLIPVSYQEHFRDTKKKLLTNIENLCGEILFDHVTFSYPTRRDKVVLKDLNLKLSPGMVVALVGESGGGKTTCTQLLQRFYDPDKGCIFLDGIDIKDLDPMFLRSQIGVVSQEPHLFGTTIKENIKFGAPYASDEDVIKAAKQANAHDFICKFPLGYNTPVGERGTQLSGGQKQRVAIAQAIMKKPKILLLDEATSALDSESEYLVQHALDELMKGKTTLIIAHRLSTVKNADQVCVITNGIIIEKGSHQELIDLKGVYKQLVDKQLLNKSTRQGV